MSVDEAETNSPLSSPNVEKFVDNLIEKRRNFKTAVLVAEYESPAFKLQAEKLYQVCLLVYESVCVCVCVYVCMYIYTYICIYKYTYIHIHIYEYIYIYVTHIHAYIHTYTDRQTHTQTHTQTHKDRQMHRQTDTHLPNIL
jgi:hypothetical protein